MSGSEHVADRNLLVGILALQLDFITSDQLIGALNVWLLQKSKPLEEILIEQKFLNEEERRKVAFIQSCAR